MNYKYSLDTSSRKFICPSCNKKRFVKYINNETGKYLSEEYGRCDRETSCTYHQKPNCETNFKPSFPTPTHHPPYPDYIPKDTFQASLSTQKQNNFVQFLKTLFTTEKVKSLILNFFIGTLNHWPGDTVFWQIDKTEKVHTGQIILYDSSNGNRIQSPFPHINWVHTLLLKQNKIPTFNLQQCLFGEHQLIDAPQTKPVAIVESAKTAIIMTGYFPAYVWMATNGSSNLNPSTLQPLLSRNIVLYPDLGQYEKWKSISVDCLKLGFKITVSDLLEKSAHDTDRQKGLDIADYFIRNSKTDAQTSQNKNLALSKLEKDLLHFTTKFPSVQTLIDELNLEIIEEPETPEPFKPTPQIPYTTPSPVAIIDSNIKTDKIFKGNDLVVKGRVFTTSSGDKIELVGLRDYGFCRRSEPHKEQKGYCRECILNCLHTIKINGKLQKREYSQLEILIMQ